MICLKKGPLGKIPGGLLVVVAACLFLFCVLFLLNTLETFHAYQYFCSYYTTNVQVVIEEENDDVKIFHSIRAGGRFDNSRQYVIHDFIQKADIWPLLEAKMANASEGSVCMATISSVGWLHHLAETSATWSGPMSVAVYAPGEDFHLFIRYMQHLRKCHASVREYVAFHVMYPKMSPPRFVQELSGDLGALSCENNSSINFAALTTFLPKTNLTRKWRRTLVYPQNHLRNVARKGCPTTHVFLTDVDIVSCAGHYNYLVSFLSKETCKRCSFVVPAYEVDNKLKSLPENKSALLALVKSGRAQLFHFKVFARNQNATNSSRWETLPVKANMEVSVAYPIDYEFLYEPYYVAEDDVPINDERFIGYGYTRSSQVFEMNASGYKFQVLDNVFVMHRGLMKANRHPGWRQNEIIANAKKFKTFLREIEFKYNLNTDWRKGKFLYGEKLW